jgi:protein TonB
VQPDYSRDAMRAKAAGVLTLKATVQADGSVSDVTVVRALYPDLDRNGIAAVRQWSFVPAFLNGRPVAAIVQIDLSFRLR